MHDENTPSLNSLFGFRYQSLIGVLRLIDLLNDKATSIIFERKDSKFDKFDDIKVFINDTIHHYQIKSNYVVDELKISSFTNKSIGLYLPNLYNSWKDTTTQFNDKKNVFHIYTTRPVTNTNPLFKYLIKVDDERKKFSEKPDKVFKLSSELLKDDRLLNTREDIPEDDVAKFFESMIIEIEQPTTPIAEYLSALVEGELGKIILHKIEQLGLHKPPNNTPIETTFRTLFHFVNKASINSMKITKSILEQNLNIVQNFDSIKNTIEFNDEEYVKTQTSFELLNEKVKQNSGNVFVIKGKPGSGKTWLLTKWLNEFKKNNPATPPIWYYSSISVTGDDDFETRITKQQILNNLIFAIHSDYGISSDVDRYAVTTKRLQDFVNQLGQLALDKNTTIPLIIDGLDHVSRIKTRSFTLSESDETVLDFIHELTIPQGICVIFGSQEGIHLDFVREKYSNDAIFEIFGFNENETADYLQKIKIDEDQVTKHSSAIFKVTTGLPLLVNYLGRTLKQTNNFDEISKIPLTEGNVEVYYNYLWIGLANSDQTRKIARHLALLEFSASMSFLDSLIPDYDRDGEKLDSCLKPIISLLRNTQENEISIFHDSFREYLLKKTNFEESLQLKYTEKIYTLLKENNLILNPISFRYGLKYALKCKKYSDIVNIVSLEFVDNSIKNLNIKDDLTNNLLYAIRASYELNDPIQVLDKGLLKKYTLERYDYLNDYTFDELILKLFPEKIQNYLFFENSLNLSLNETIWFLAKSIEMNIPIAAERIVMVWHDALQSTNYGKIGHLPKNISLSAYGFVLCYVDGLDSLVNWIKGNQFSITELSEIIKRILPLKTFDEITDINQLKGQYGADWLIIELLVLFFYNKQQEFSLKFMDFLQSNAHQQIEEIIEYIRFSKITNEYFTAVKNMPKIEPPNFDNARIEQFIELQRQVAFYAYTDDQEGLERIKESFNEQGSNFFIQILLLVTNVTRVSVLENARINDSMITEVYESLSTFVNYDGHRIFDEPGHNNREFAKLLAGIIKKSFKIVLQSNNNQLKESLIDLIPKFGHKYMFTYLDIQNLVEFALDYASNEDLKNKALSKIPKTIGISDTQDMINFSLSNATLNINLQNYSKAKEDFLQVVDLSFSYRYHKDLLLDELRTLSKLIIDDGFLTRTKTILDLTNYLEIITDGDETRHIHIDAILDLTSLYPSIGYVVASQYGVDSYTFEQMLSEFVEKCKNCPVLMRYFILKTRFVHISPHRYSPSIGFDERIRLIEESSITHPSDAKIMLNDLKMELQKDFPDVNNATRMMYNEEANVLGMPVLELANEERVETPPDDIESIPDDEDVDSMSIEEICVKIENSYAWSWGSGKKPEELLKTAYAKNPELTNKFVIESITNRCLNNHWEPEGIIHTYGKYLANTSQFGSLAKLYKSTERFVWELFRFRNLPDTWNFESITKTTECISDVEAGFELLISKLTSLDTEVIKRTISSIVMCLINNVDGLFDYCIHKFSNTTNPFLKEKLAAVLDIYTTETKRSDSKIINVAKEMKLSKNRRIVNTGAHILQTLSVE